MPNMAMFVDRCAYVLEESMTNQVREQPPPRQNEMMPPTSFPSTPPFSFPVTQIISCISSLPPIDLERSPIMPNNAHVMAKAAGYVDVAMSIVAQNSHISTGHKAP